MRVMRPVTNKRAQDKLAASPMMTSVVRWRRDSAVTTFLRGVTIVR